MRRCSSHEGALDNLESQPDRGGPMLPLGAFPPVGLVVARERVLEQRVGDAEHREPLAEPEHAREEDA